MSETYEYKVVNISLEPSPDPYGLRRATIETAANRWAEMGWRTVAVMPSQGSGYADAILVEREKEEDLVIVRRRPRRSRPRRERQDRDD